MKSEKLTNKRTAYSISLSGNRVDSLRITEDLKTVARVYENGYIGVAGEIGVADENELYKAAQANLAQKIEYPCNLTNGGTREENHANEIIAPDKFVKTIKKLLERLTKTYPDFIFSNKINMTADSDAYENSEGTLYKDNSARLDVGIVIQHKESSNIMDLGYFATQDYYDEDKIVEDMGKLLTAYNKKAELPKENVPVFISEEAMFKIFAELTAEKYGSGSSLFNGKMGQKIYDDKFSLLTDRVQAAKTGLPFFDCEGVVNKDGKFYFIKNGVLTGLATTKRTAAQYNLPLSGGANSEFDNVPVVAIMGAAIERTCELKDVIKGKAIYVDTASGGDMTPDGVFGIPVQLAYLYENGKLVARLPEFLLSAKADDIFGKDFIGAARNSVFEYSDSTVLIGNFTITRRD